MSRDFVLPRRSLAFVLPAAATPRRREMILRPRGAPDSGTWAPRESLATAALARSRRRRRRLTCDRRVVGVVATARWKLVATPRRGDPSGVAFARHPPAPAARAPETGAAHSLLARFLSGTGRPDSARLHVQHALDIRTKQLAADDTLVAKTWDQLAVVHRDRNDFQAALDAWTRAIDIRKRVHGSEHPEVALLLARPGVPGCARHIDRPTSRRFAHDVRPQLPAGDPRRATPLNFGRMWRAVQERAVPPI